LISDQERFYQITLPRSYKKKLENVFLQSYLSAAEAFKSGDLGKARDLWAESLVFPIYAGDIQKHRGVVLTMLRPFVNDTLSKIGAVNHMLIVRQVRDKESALSDRYAELCRQIENRAWAEALSSILKCEEEIQALESPGMLVAEPPPYPAGIREVDRDIQATLYELLKPSPVTVADLGPIKQDLALKKKVIQGFLPENLEKVQKCYHEALEMVHQQRWDEAERLLRGVEYPVVLAKDAQEKVKILKKLKMPALDSGSGSA
ncbi:MAG: hypothetical protein NC930_04330, partial [Candidatus Omnitrophica bacterium]|nr:hypothetical protein [Candidatus Omnitrophota bacterium]